MPGSLTIAGSGIASVAHMTLETLGYLQEADSVFYVVADPVTEAFIHKNAKGSCSDLYVFYDKDKPRYDTYVQMAETMLNAVRAGQKVLGIFYGHPGVFVSPTRRALAIAREEGYEAKMLPGVSAEDYMFADLEVDPATHGCCAYEATHFLLKNVPLNTSIHNIIWQVGAVGVTTMDFENPKFTILVDRLEKDYGIHHGVVHYIGAVLPQSVTVKDIYTVSDLRKPEVAAQFNTCSTLYIPPLKGDTPFSEQLTQQLFGAPSHMLSAVRYPVAPWDVDTHTPATPAYGIHEQAVVASMENHVPPADYRKLMGSPALQQLMAELALRHALRAKYMADPKAVVDGTPGLTDVERAALLLKSPNPINAVMKPRPGDDLTESDLINYPVVAVGVVVILILQGAVQNVTVA